MRIDLSPGRSSGSALLRGGHIGVLGCILGVGLLAGWDGCHPPGRSNSSPPPAAGPPSTGLRTLAALEPAPTGLRPDARPGAPVAPLTVVGYGPQGKVLGGGTIYIRFNQAAAPLA